MSNTGSWAHAQEVYDSVFGTAVQWLMAQVTEYPQYNHERFVVTLDRVGISLTDCCALYALGGGVALRAYLDSLPNPYYLPESVDHG